MQKTSISPYLYGIWGKRQPVQLRLTLSYLFAKIILSFLFVIRKCKIRWSLIQMEVDFEFFVERVNTEPQVQLCECQRQECIMQAPYGLK